MARISAKPGSNFFAVRGSCADLSGGDSAPWKWAKRAPYLRLGYRAARHIAACLRPVSC